MPYSTRNGIRIYYEVSGEGYPMVLLHPGPFDHSVWLYQIARFSAHFKVIAIDMRSHGRSENIETAYEIADQADDVLGVLDDEGVNTAILAGVSFSAKVAVWLAARHPDRLAALILVGGNSGMPSTNRHEPRIEAYFRDGVAAVMPGHLADGTTAEFARSRLGTYILNIFIERAPWGTPLAQTQNTRTRTTSDLTPLLPEIAIPTLVVNGEHDNALEGGTETARLIPGATHRILAGAGHACCMDHPAEFDAAVIEFLNTQGLMPNIQTH